MAAAAPAGTPTSTPAAGRFTAPWDGRAGAPKLWHFVLLGAVAGAFPDLDSVVEVAGDVAYLRHHRGVTHSLLLLPLWAALLAWLAARAAGVTRGQAGGWKSFYAVAAAAIGVHIAGDWITSFGTMLLAPLSDERFGLGVVFIIDLVFTGVLLAGLVLAAALPRRRWPAMLGLALAAGWVGVCWTGHREAVAAGREAAARLGVNPKAVLAFPRPASPFNWTVAIDDGAAWRLAHVNTRRTQAVVARPDDHFIRRFGAPYAPLSLATWATVPQPDTPQAPPWVLEAWRSDAFAFYRWFSDAPALLDFDSGATAAGGGARCATFRDLRFEFPGREAAPFRYGVCLPPTAGGAAGVFRLDDGVRVPVAAP
jgi:inner membrane protein